jgi:glycerol-3-phosphate dehydrogenase
MILLREPPRRSSRILSGLRSLEQGDVAFAREKIRVQQRLVRKRPHLVYPAHFLMVHSPDNRRSAMTARTALWLYSAHDGRQAGHVQL